MSPASSKIMVCLVFAFLAALIISAGCTDLINSVNPFAEQSPATPVATTAVTLSAPATAVVTETPVAPGVNTTTGPAATSETTPAAGVTPSPQATAGARTYLTYTNTSYGFSIDYPSDWTVQEAPVETGQDPGVPAGYTSKTDVVEFYSPAVSRCYQGTCVDVRAEMHVQVDPSPPDTDLDQYYIHDVAAISQNYPIDITGHDAGFKLSGQNAYELDYHVQDDPIDIRVERAYTIAAGKAFVLTYHVHAPHSGEVDQGVIYSNVVVEMFRSFRVISANKTL